MFFVRSKGTIRLLMRWLLFAVTLLPVPPIGNGISLYIPLPCRHDGSRLMTMTIIQCLCTFVWCPLLSFLPWCLEFLSCFLLPCGDVCGNGRHTIEKGQDNLTSSLSSPAVSSMRTRNGVRKLQFYFIFRLFSIFSMRTRNDVRKLRFYFTLRVFGISAAVVAARVGHSMPL